MSVFLSIATKSRTSHHVGDGPDSDIRVLKRGGPERAISWRDQFPVAPANASVKARIIDLGGTVLPGSPGEFGEYIANETEKWAKVIKFADIKPE